MSSRIAEIPGSCRREFTLEMRAPGGAACTFAFHPSRTCRGKLGSTGRKMREILELPDPTLSYLARYFFPSVGSAMASASSLAMIGWYFVNKALSSGSWAEFAPAVKAVLVRFASF